MSRKELLPALDLVLETYVTGLDRDYDIAQSLADQFSVGEPSYSAGLVFEVPLHRRAARARLQRRQLERRQITQQFEEVVLTLRAEVEVAIREVSATYRELVARRPLLEVVANPCSCRRSRQLRPRGSFGHGRSLILQVACVAVSSRDPERIEIIQQRNGEAA